MTIDHTDTPEEAPRCTGTAKSTGARCKRRPIPGGTVCVKHGGGAPQVRNAAQARLRQRDAILALETFGISRTVDPHTALLEELHRTAGAVEWLGAIVAGLDRGDVTWGQTKSKTGGDDAGDTYEARPNAWVTLWQGERKHLVEVSKACVAAGIEERRIRLAESQGQLLAGVVRAVLDRLDLTAVQRDMAVVVVPEEFRRLAEVMG